MNLSSHFRSILRKPHLYRQNGQTIENSKPEFDLGQLAEFDSITDEFCGESKNLYGDYNDHEIKGGLKVNTKLFCLHKNT